MPDTSSAPGAPALPWRALLVAGALYLLTWTLLPPLLISSFPLDVVESLSWGREWQWGYYKHPPLAPWLLHLSYRAFGAAGPFLLSQLCIAATLWLVWLAGCRLMERERALLGTVLTLGVAFYGHPALEFNHNIAQMPLWAGLGWALLAALQDGRLRHWLALGALAGLGLLTKYSVAIVLACLGLYLVLGPALFAWLTTTPVDAANAAAVHEAAARLLHYSPEPRVIEKLIASARLLGREDEAALHADRYRRAWPRDWARFSRGLPASGTP